MKRHKKRIDQGFTLIELLVVITIIAILASAAVPTFSIVQDKANQAASVGNARQIIAADIRTGTRRMNHRTPTMPSEFSSRKAF